MLQAEHFYNEKQKQQFISDVYSMYEMSAIKAITVFNKIATVEHKFSKDFAEFNPDEVKDIVGNCVVALSTSTRIVTLSILKRYVRWCAKEGIISDRTATIHGIMVQTAGSVGSTDPDTIKRKMTNTMLKSKEDFIYFLDTFMRAEKNEMVRACCCLLWLGFSIQEIFQIRIDDVDVDNISIRGVQFHSDDLDLIHIINGVANSQSFSEFHKHGNSNRLSEFTYNYMPTEFVIRSARTRTSNYSGNKAPFITRRITEIEREIRPTLPDGHRFKNFTGTFSSITSSAAFCKVHAYKQDNGDKDMRENITNLLDISNTRMNIHCKYNDYMMWEQYCIEK